MNDTTVQKSATYQEYFEIDIFNYECRMCYEYNEKHGEVYVAIVMFCELAE